MNIEQFKEEKFKLEHEIHEFLDQKIEQFFERTGISPSEIRVSTVESSAIGSRDKKYLVEDCEVKVDIF